MTCDKSGGCGVYENRSCSECPASKPEYIENKVNMFLKEIHWYEKCDKHKGDKCEHGKCQYSVWTFGNGFSNSTCGRYDK